MEIKFQSKGLLLAEFLPTLVFREELLHIQGYEGRP